MKRVLKFLIVPLAFSCCSIASNASSVRFSAFSVDSKDNKNLYLRAYLDILVDKYDKKCECEYSWKGSDGISHKCGTSSVPSLFYTSDYPLDVSEGISREDLKKYSPITFTCEATVKGETSKYRTRMTYNSQTIDDFTISESTNKQELTTGYLEVSTSPEPVKNYCYEDVFSFLNYEDLRVNELYYDIDISYLRFKYHNGFDEALKGDFRFAFYDRYNLFPDFEIGKESMYRYIPLTFNREGEECYFTFTPTIYYDPVTHESSTKHKERYLPYHHLMLPFGYESELKFLPCYLELKVKSHTDFTIYGKFTITYLKKFFGDCEDSEFCDRIHQDGEINIREKIVEVNT